MTLRSVFLLACASAILLGCRRDYRLEADQGVTRRYQQAIAQQGAQTRLAPTDANDPQGLDVLRAVGTSQLGPVEVSDEESPGGPTETQQLSLPQAIAATLANSPQIREVSFDPAIAEQEVIRSQADYDWTLFGRANAEDNKRPTSTISEISRSEVALFESGLRKKTEWGGEVSTSYLLTNSWDDLFNREPSRRFEPVLAFQLRQPLLRDAWKRVNLAGIDIAKLGHSIALLDFQSRAEELVTEVTATYWQLYQTQQDQETFRELLARATQTLEKVMGRREIDATDVQIRQAQVSVHTRQALTVQAGKRVMDARDNLVRLMADSGLSLVDDTHIELTSRPKDTLSDIKSEEVLRRALQRNPILRQGRARIEIAEVNLMLANRQKMPRLDLVASASTQTLARDYGTAHDQLEHTLHKSFGIGLVMEIPLGNRVRKAELQSRKFERQKAIATLQATTDQVAAQARERTRGVQSHFAEIAIQNQAAEAALAHLLALEETEQIRDRLTPEFLLVKLQAQDGVADAQRATTQALVQYNIALAQLVQTTGGALALHEMYLPSTRNQFESSP